MVSRYHGSKQAWFARCSAPFAGQHVMGFVSLGVREVLMEFGGRRVISLLFTQQLL